MEKNPENKKKKKHPRESYKIDLKLHKKNLHSEALQMPPTKVLTLQSTTGPLQFLCHTLSAPKNMGFARLM